MSIRIINNNNKNVNHSLKMFSIRFYQTLKHKITAKTKTTTVAQMQVR